MKAGILSLLLFVAIAGCTQKTTEIDLAVEDQCRLILFNAEWTEHPYYTLHNTECQRYYDSCDDNGGELLPFNGTLSNKSYSCAYYIEKTFNSSQDFFTYTVFKQLTEDITGKIELDTTVDIPPGVRG